MKKRFFVLVGTSGSGKTTIMNLLRERHKEFCFPVAATTRDPRPHEVPGTTYTFVSDEEFQRMITSGELLEWAINHSKEYYGMLRKPVEDALNKGQIVVREMSIAGLKETLETDLGNQVYSIFLTPPSLELMRQRILKRSALPEEEITRRMESAKKEITESDICDTKILAEENEVEKIYNQVLDTILRVAGEK